MPQIESLLSARLFLTPQVVDDRVYFLSNLSGRLSLYVMDLGGSVPTPLLPPQIALQNPHLAGGYVFWVFPELQAICVMIDRDGDENYQPMLIPLDGGVPESAFGDQFAAYRVHMAGCDMAANVAYFDAESRKDPVIETYQGNLATRSLVLIDASPYGASVAAHTADQRRAILVERYTTGDSVLKLWDTAGGAMRVLYGTPFADRAAGELVPLTGFRDAAFSEAEDAVLCVNAIFEDTFGLSYLELDRPQQMQPIAITGVQHAGWGELESVEHLQGNRYLVGYNIDGCSWLYEGAFDRATLALRLDTVLCGSGALHDGVLESVRFDAAGDRYALSFSTAISPTQLLIVQGASRSDIRPLTRERVLGVAESQLAPGEDATFTSFDGQRISARLYLPSPSLGFQGRRPLVYYVHGGPQGQERPDFAWFSMPLIQFLTMNGFAVFVPNVRGSTGYGLSFTTKVDRDWGGDDRLDHVHAMQILREDARLDVGRTAVIGRSYGGYMTLTLAGRHPELWAAAVDMFGPSNLLLFLEKIPPTWKPYYVMALGDVEKDHDMLVERSPSTYLGNVACPMLVIQGQNDPRVVASESRDVVERLRTDGKQVDFLLFENEGHDVLKFENRVTCYNAITDFFRQHLHP